MVLFLRRHRLAVLLVIQFLAGVAASPVLAFLPVYVAERLQLGQDFTANARAIWLGAMVLFSLVGGALSDAIGRKSTLIAGLSGTLLGAAVFVSDSTWLVGLALPALMGVAEGLFIAAGQSYLLDVSPANRLSVMTALYFAGFTVGNMAGGVAGGAIAEWGGYGALALAVAAATIAVLLMAIFLLPAIDSAGDARRPGLRESLVGYGELLRRRSIQLLVAMQALRTVFWGAFGLMGPVLVDGLTGSKLIVGWFVGATTGVGLLSMLAMGRYSDRHGRRGPVLVTLAGTSAGAVLIGVFAAQVFGLFVAGTITAAFAWALSGQVTPLAKELVGPGQSGRAIGLVTAPWGLAALIGAQTGGRMVETRAAEAFYICAGLALLALLCGWWLFRAMESPKPEAALAR